MGRYVALGSSMAAGPGLWPRAAGSPLLAMRSTRNYPHLVAQRCGLDLIDVTYSGATTANILTRPQRGAPPQVTALDGSEEVVTVTIGGNDVGYVPLLSAATLPTALRGLLLIGGWCSPRVAALLPAATLTELLDPEARQRALDRVGSLLRTVGETLRARSPRARILFVDYLTLLPPPGIPAPPLEPAVADLGRRLAAGLAAATAEAVAATDCELVAAAAASRDHHAWSAEPWTTGAGTITGALLRRRPLPFHPTAAGMAAVADLVARQLSPLP